jgi:Transposase DNA-binding/Transposase Tn5 dimerisation domain
MNERQDARTWAEAEFRGVPRLEKRWQDRLIECAATLAQRPNGTLPQRLDWAELKGTYRLIHDADATPEVLQAVHRQRTRDRMIRDRPVLIVHDGTEQDFTSHRSVVDRLGPTGNGAGRGFLQHNSLAIDPQRGELLGLVHQQTYFREPTPDGETRAERQLRPDRESAVWAAGIRAVGPMPAGNCWVHVGDRGADYFEAMAMARLNGCHFLIRLCQDRRVRRSGADDARQYLMAAARGLAAELTDMVEVSSKGGRPPRQARVCLASTRVLIEPPVQDKKWRGHPPIAATVIRVWEPNPPEGVEALEWVLGTDRLVSSPAELLRYRDWYTWRWRTAEEYHKVQKTGCRIEELRFETPQRLSAAMAVLSVVAIRVLSLRWQRDAAAEAAAETVATPLEVAVVEKAARSRQTITTVRQFVDGVARLGGYLGRKCDGPPGWQTLWRGYQRLADILLGIELLQPVEADETNLPRSPRSG